ncbi:MAG: YdcF family protein [Bryobacteraceae bacterium]|nr:YdcF family protein [Bryobacteraceae bacterium]
MIAGRCRLILVHINEESLRAARVIWQFHAPGWEVAPGDVVIALGTNDLRVAEFAADLFLRGFGRLLLCTGGIAHQDDLLATRWDRTEAEMYADVAVGRGVPRDRVVLETRAKNTSENVRFSRALLGELGLEPQSVVVAVKPFMQRRAWASWQVGWPEMPASFASPVMGLDEYFTADLPADKILHILMGDLQRLWVYGQRGWSAPQEIPDEVRQAYRYLKAEGWTKHLLAGEEDL